MTTATTSRRLELVPLDEIAPADRNPKGHDTAGIARSVGKFGYVDPVIMDERTGKLVAGHGRLGHLQTVQAAEDAPPEGIEVGDDGRWLVPVIRGWQSRSDEEAEAYLVASNRLTENGGWDERELAELLGDLADAQLLDVAGYSTDDYDDLVAALQESTDRDAAASSNTSHGNGLDDLADDYAASSSRLLVMSYSGARYVWVVEQLGELLDRYDVESNAAVLVALLEETTGQTAPAEDAPAPAEDADPEDPGDELGLAEQETA